MVEITSGARRFSSATAGIIRSAPGTYNAPAGYRKSICVSMSKKTVFTLHLLVKRHQFRAVLDAIFLIGVEQAANRGGQPLDGFGGVLPGRGYRGQRFHQLAAQQHRTQQRKRFAFTRLTTIAPARCDGSIRDL